MAASDAKWYVIHTYSGYEAMVKDSLEKLIENNNLQENIFDIQIPTEETLEEKANGKKKVVERKKFPCYVFLKMIYSNNIWYLVMNGPLESFTGKVTELNEASQKVKVDVVMFGRVTNVELDFVQVKKITVQN